MAEGFVTRRGGGGIDVSDATATENEVLQGETFYSGDTNIKTGNIPSKGAETFTPGTTNQTITSGQYLSGTQTILGDADLIPKNIVDGVTIFGVTGNAQTASYYLSFDGVDDRVDIPHSTDFNITDKLSYEFWLYADSNQNNTDPFIISKNESGDEYIEAHIQAGSGEDYMRFIPNTSPIDTSPGTISYNEWVHWAVTYDQSGQNAAVYKNGQPVSFTGPSSFPSMAVNTTLLRLGDRSIQSLPFKGFIREVRIWNTYRTSSEIANNYNIELTGNETGLVAYYNFNEGSGTTLGDIAGNNDGTIIGATWVEE